MWDIYLVKKYFYLAHPVEPFLGNDSWSNHKKLNSNVEVKKKGGGIVILTKIMLKCSNREST